LENIEIILTRCIADIRSGRATLDECLDRYPQQRHELEPLLRTAMNIEQPPFYRMDENYKRAARVRLLQQIESTGKKKNRSFMEIFSFGLPRQLIWARVALTALVILILITLLAGGTAYAAQESLPGDPLYPVKIGTEDARLLLAGNNADKAELNLEFAQTRLMEMSRVASRNREQTELAFNGYRDNLDAAEQQIRNMANNSVSMNQMEMAMENVRNQLEYCDRIMDSNPEFIEPVRNASMLTVTQQSRFINMLSLQNNLRATQINLDLMQNRLLRAEAKVNSNQYQMMEQALVQYRQFSQVGLQILENAQNEATNNTEIERLNQQAMQGYRNILDSFPDNIPLTYRNSIENCLQITEQLRIRAMNRNQIQDNFIPGPQEPGSLKDEGTDKGQDKQNNEQSQNAGNSGSGTGSYGGTGGGSGGGGGGSGGSGK